MVFNFGAAPGPSPAPASGGFQLGAPAASNTSAASTGGFSASSGTASAAPSTAAPAFTFGGTPATAPAPAGPAATPAGAPAPLAAATGGFSFGGTPAASAPGPAAASTASAPATGGFSFGGTPAAAAPAPTANAPAPVGTPAPGFSLGGSAAAPAAATTTPAPAPAAGGFSFSSTPAATTSALGTPTPAPASTGPPATLQVPSFEDTFGNFQMYTQVQKWCEEDSELAGQELVHLIHSAQDKLVPKMPDWKPPNPQLRQQLAQNPTALMNYNNSAPVATTLTRKVLERILDLATDLRISEPEATCLYAQVSSELETIQEVTPSGMLKRAGITRKKFTPMTSLAREFYFYERHLRLQTLLFLFQSRLSNDSKVLQATDKLLEDGIVPTLVKLIMDYNQRIMQLMQELSANKSINPLMVAPTSAPSSEMESFAQVHLLFCQQERQCAAEILLFIAYHTQLTPKEMAALLDLIRDMSPMLQEHCPFTNVPSPYDIPGASNLQTQTWPQQAATPFQSPLKEKSFFVWQQELVATVFKSGQPQVLQCMSVLVVAAMAAMDTKQVLYDRETHTMNPYRGNQFLPPGAPSPSTPGVTEIHKRLSTQTILTTWSRKDIGGLLNASFVLMLRSTAPTLMGSPRVGGHPELKEAARDLSTAADMKSFSFCRLTLIPALQRLPASQICRASEFGLSVVAETFAHYLRMLPEGQLPMSRQRWLLEEEEELRLRREAQDRNRQFSAWQSQGFGNGFGGNPKEEEEVIPVSVDLMNRPDCLDDIIALATSICGLGSEYSVHFWSQDSTSGELTPCRTLLELEQYQTKDDTLLPSYLSWLAALSNDPKSAQLVHQILAGDSTPTNSAESGNAESLVVTPTAGSLNGISWTKILYNLRWYAQELSPYESDVVNKAPTTSTTTKTTTSTDYYYNLEGDAVDPAIRTTTTSRTTGGSSSTGGSGTSSSTSKTKELSDESCFYLSSHLALIRNVCSHSLDAKYSILSILLPLGDSSALAGGDEALLILFKLAIAPLPSTIRGATLGTIGKLLRIPSSSGINAEQRKFFAEKARNGWEYLETCPLLPIAQLDQYFVLNPAAMDARARVGLAFPPSSLALANAQSVETVLPKNPNYGLFYEMEHVESSLGVYPATEGSLELLQSLIATGGCPATLGQQWRLRPGVSPYVEYVTDFVLPRTLGSDNLLALPFRTHGDRCRMMTKALSVVHSVLLGYSVPTQDLKMPAVDPKRLLGIPAVIESLVGDKESSVPLSEALQDFKNAQITPGQLSLNTSQNSDHFSTPDGTMALAPSTSLPSAKSPGFVILSDLLSSAGGTIFQAVALILTYQGGANEIEEVVGSDCDNIALSYALFGATPPDVSSAKEGAKEGGPSRLKQSFLKPLTPMFEDFVVDTASFDNAISWREQSISTALHILCSTIIQEEAFVARVAASKEALKIVPLLRFQQIRYGSSNLRVVDVTPSRLAQRLFTSSNSGYIRSSVIECIGYRANDDSRDATLAASALAVTFFLQQQMPRSMPITALSGNKNEKVFSRNVGMRLLASIKRSQDMLVENQTATLILDWMLHDLRSGTIARGLIHALLGFPSDSAGRDWKSNKIHLSRGVKDCFDALLELTQGLCSSKFQSLCLEVFFRLYNLLGQGDASSVQTALYTAERLRRCSFWQSKLLNLVGPYSQETAPPFEENAHKTHCTAWILKGLASELNLLAGYSTDLATAGEMGGLLQPQPAKFNHLIELMFGSSQPLLLNLLDNLSLKKIPIDSSFPSPPQDVLQSVVQSLPGPADVFDGYYQVETEKTIEKVAKKSPGFDEEPMRGWCKQWNQFVERDCSTSHLAGAISALFDAALTSTEVLQESLYDLPLISSSTAMTMNAKIMEKLLEYTVADNRHIGMDVALYPNATRHLANTVLLLTSFTCDEASKKEASTSYLVWMASVLARAVSLSSLGDNSDAEADLRYERTTVFSTALSMVLRETASDEPKLLHQHREDYIVAADAMKTLSTFPVSIHSNESLAVASVIARSSLETLIEVCSDPDDTLQESFVFNLFAGKNAAGLLERITSLDVDISSLLRSIASQKYGTGVLIDAGIFGALQSAAVTYMQEEKRMHQRIGQHQSEYEKKKLLSPAFLMGHLKLLSTMMVSLSSESEKQELLARNVIKLLQKYALTFQRLCFNFPTEADLLKAFVQCLVQASTTAYPADLGQRHRELTSSASISFKQLFAESGLIDKGLIVLCTQLMENPLPRSLLPNIPKGLAPNAAAWEGNVRVESNKEQSWWDVLDLYLRKRKEVSKYVFAAPVGSNDYGFWDGKKPEHWSDDKFEYSLVALEIFEHSLCMLKKLNRLHDLDRSAIARGLYQFSLASQTVQNRIEEVQMSLGTASSIMDTSTFTSDNPKLELEYLKVFGSKITTCLEQLLVAALTVLPEGSKENLSNSWKPFRVAIEQSGLGSKGVGLSWKMGEADGRRQLAEAFVSKILEEIQ